MDEVRKAASMTFDPDWVISPGETLRDWIEENGLTPRSTATTCGLKVAEVKGILAARRKLTPRIAAHLASGTGIPERLWLNLERAYRNGLAAGKIDASEPAGKGRP